MEAVADAYERAFLRLEREEGPVNFDDADEREKCRLDGPPDHRGAIKPTSHAPGLCDRARACFFLLSSKL